MGAKLTTKSEGWGCKVREGARIMTKSKRGGRMRWGSGVRGVM